MITRFKVKLTFQYMWLLIKYSQRWWSKSYSRTINFFRNKIASNYTHTLRLYATLINLIPLPLPIKRKKKHCFRSKPCSEMNQRMKRKSFRHLDLCLEQGPKAAHAYLRCRLVVSHKLTADKSKHQKYRFREQEKQYIKSLIQTCCPLSPSL